MNTALNQCALFAGMTPAEREAVLACCGASVACYEKDEAIFRPWEKPGRLLILLEGTIVVSSEVADGRRSVVATFSRPGELFGEVFVFLGQDRYEHFAEAAGPVRVLQIPRDFLYHTCGNSCASHARMISNMLAILARKAYFLNQRVRILSCASLRQKLARTLLLHAQGGSRALLPMNREELADYVGAARPSVSRELMAMQADGLIAVHRGEIRILDRTALEDLG